MPYDICYMKYGIRHMAYEPASERSPAHRDGKEK
jgi:hypothetical protein